MRIGFITLTDPDRPAPSTRIAVLNMLPYLHAAGHQTEFLHSVGGTSLSPRLPDSLAEDCTRRGLDVVVFQKVQGTNAAALARRLERRLIRTVYLVCDIVDPEMADATSVSIVVNETLRNLYPPELRPKVHVVHDGIERPELEIDRDAVGLGRKKGPLRAVLVTAQGLDHVPVLGNRLPPWLRLSIVGRYPPDEQRLDRFRSWRWALQEQPDLRRRLLYLGFSAHPRIRRVAWGTDTVYSHLLAADIGIIPIVRDNVPDPLAGGVPNWMVRSENRLTLKMALGLPVVATPIPAYESVIEQGVNGFLAQTIDDWRRMLEQLRDPCVRHRVGSMARVSVLERYSKDRQAMLTLALLSTLVETEQSKTRPVDPTS